MSKRWGLAAFAATALMLVAGSPAQASPPAPRVTEIDQVSNQPGHAKLTDPDVVNAWGLALGPTTPLWVANNGTNTATVYTGGLGGATVGKAGLIVVNDSDGVTGQVFNGSADFVVTTPQGSGPARFLFDSESGDITAWAPAATGTHAVVVAHVDGAVFKGLALWQTPLGTFLLATDFAHGRIDVFDRTFRQVDLAGELFKDPRLPTGYAPFNVMTNGDAVTVTYAKQQAGSADEQAGPGLGIVNEFRHVGTTVTRIASRGTLNAPWGLAIAPSGFGKFTGALLVGNFGDGRISAFRGDHFIGQLRNTGNSPVAIDGLWALLPGTATTGGVGTVWFSAGPNDEQDGLVGQLIPTR
jgi:uncharacterized protein (TIGR03118 family)